jgi:RHS repeat-associated protein
MTSRTEPDLFTQWTWGSTAASDNIGQLASVCTGNSATPGLTPTACTANSTTVPGYSESESYDSAGRLSQVSIVIPSGGSGGGTFNYGYQYNSSGQLGTLTYPTTVGSPLQLQYNYSNGIVQSIVDVVPDSVTLWTANASNADGQITQETVGNGVVINRSYDPVTQWLNSVTAGVNGGATLENQSYEYDEVGNVTQRQENNLGLTENFYYDNLNRLYYSQLNSVTNLQMCYDNSGGSCTENVAGPGSITSKTADAVAQSSYTATWTSYNYPSKIATASESVQFSYGPDRQRWQQNYNSGAEITNYIGQLLEQVVTTSGTGYRQYVYAGAEPVAVLAPSSSGNTVTYMLADQEGSIAALLNSSGAADVNESFTAYGSRRNPATWSGAPSSSDLTTIAGLTRQGYTFQTALGQFMGFNHMNGRVQDAITGQFMSPDPNIPDPTNTQDYNRYTYVGNNPLSRTDPSGFCQIDILNEPGLDCLTLIQMADAGWGVSFADPGDPQNLPLENAMAANGQGFFLQPADSSLSWLFGPGPFAGSSSSSSSSSSSNSSTSSDSSDSSADPGDLNAPLRGAPYGVQYPVTDANSFACGAYLCEAQMGLFDFSATQNGVYLQVDVSGGTVPPGGQWVQTVLLPTGNYVTDNAGNPSSPFYPSNYASGNQFYDDPANGNAFPMTWQAQASYVAPNQSGASLTFQWGFSRNTNGAITPIQPYAAAPWFAQLQLIQSAQGVLNGTGKSQ